MSDNFVVSKTNREDSYGYLNGLWIAYAGLAEDGHFHIVNMDNFGGRKWLTKGAEGDAELIAKLLNWYYSDIGRAENTIAAHILSDMTEKSEAPHD